MSGRVAVIGDVTGHPAALQSVLISLGVGFEPSSPSGIGWGRIDLDWPADLRIVQVGDLVHRGPDSLGVVSLAGRLIADGVWTQLVGNHEQLYVDRPVFEWPETIDPRAQHALRAWWGDGRMIAGAVIGAADGDWLVTHAGLTAGYWEHGLGAPRSAGDLLAALAEAQTDGALWHPGRMLTGRVDHSAGPIWAEAGLEVYASWLDSGLEAPFHQAHGHSTAFDWDQRRWLGPRSIRRRIDLDETARLATFSWGDTRIVGTDPGHGIAAAPVQAALVLPDADVHTA